MFSLVSASQDVSICVRCQLRLAAKRSPLLPKPETRLSQLVQCRNLSSGRREPQAQNLAYSQSAEGDVASVSLPRWRQSTPDEPIHPHSPQNGWKGVPIGDHDDHITKQPAMDQHRWSMKRRGHPNTHLNSSGGKEIDLGVNSLGKPAKIRVLRSASKSQHDRRGTDSKAAVLSPEESTTNTVDLLESFSKESQNVDTITVNANIEHLRRTLFSKLSRDESPTLSQCRYMARQLYDGFTKPQLETYVQSSSSPVAKHYSDLGGLFRSEICTRSRFFSGESAFPAKALLRLDPQTEKTMMDKFIIGVGGSVQGKKRDLVEKVIRRSWKVRCAEEKSRHGEIDIRLQEHHLSVLLHHKMAFFNTVAKVYDAKVDISKSNNLIRLSGTYGTCSELSRLIYFTIEKVKCEEIYLSAVPRTWPLDLRDSTTFIARTALREKAFITQFQRLTNTSIKIFKTSEGKQASRLEVYYLGPGRADIDDVCRLIIQLMEPAKNLKTKVQCIPPIEYMRLSQVPVEVGSDLPLAESMHKWTRWFHKPSPGHDKLDGLRSFNNSTQNKEQLDTLAQFLFDDSKQHSSLPAKSRRNEYWKPHLIRSCSATIGHIIYPIIPQMQTVIEKESLISGSSKTQIAIKGATSPSKIFDQLRNRPHAIVSNLPHVPQLIERTTSMIFHIKNELHIRLKPFKIEFSEAMDLSAFPDIELRFASVKSTPKPTLMDARLVSQIRESDLLLPTQPADVRYKSTVYRSATSTIDPQILKFIDESNLNTGGVDRLTTPSKLRLTLPFDLLPLSAKPKNGAETSVNVEYAFAGLEHHSILHAKDRSGFRLSYTTIEAGKIGGRRVELKLASMPFNLTTSQHLPLSSLPQEEPKSTIAVTGVPKEEKIVDSAEAKEVLVVDYKTRDNDPERKAEKKLHVKLMRSKKRLEKAMKARAEKAKSAGEEDVATNTFLPLHAAAMEFIQGLRTMAEEARDAPSAEEFIEALNTTQQEVREAKEARNANVAALSK